MFGSGEVLSSHVVTRLLFTSNLIARGSGRNDVYSRAYGSGWNLKFEGAERGKSSWWHNFLSVRSRQYLVVNHCRFLFLFSTFFMAMTSEFMSQDCVSLESLFLIFPVVWSDLVNDYVIGWLEHVKRLGTTIRKFSPRCHPRRTQEESTIFWG